MRLSQFILANMQSIVVEWQSFASSILPDKSLTKLVLRDRAEEILKAIATEMETPQTSWDRAEKSKGRGHRLPTDSAAETHAVERLRLGFNLAQMASEYRALRATVIRLWSESSPDLDDSAIYQLIRFNEALDQRHRGGRATKFRKMSATLGIPRGNARTYSTFFYGT